TPQGGTRRAWDYPLAGGMVGVILKKPPGRKKRDPPLCGSTAMSHNEFQSSKLIEPQEASPMQHEMHVLGLDIAKHVFHAVGMDDRGNVVYRKRVSRHDLMPCIAQLPPGRIGIAACGGAH